MEKQKHSNKLNQLNINGFVTTMAGALAASAIAGGVSSVVGGMAQADAAGKAASAQERMFNKGLAERKPFEDFASSAMDRYTNLMQNPWSVTNTPGYQFLKEQGLGAVERQQSAAGKLFSGEGATGLMQYAEGYANQAWQTQLGSSLDAARMGAGVATAGTQATTQTGASLAQIEQNKGAAIAGAAGGTIGAVGDYFAAPGYADYLNTKAKTPTVKIT